MARDYVLYTATWLLLVILTCASWVIGHHAPIGVAGPSLVVAASILSLAFVKVGMVMGVFMDLRAAPYPLVAVAAGWLVVECALLVACISR